MGNVSVDTNGIWQIGTPQKTSFINAFSPALVIVTDTLNSYPANDTSAFEITHAGNGGMWGTHTLVLSGYYSADIAAGDSGKIEFSPDNGLSWVNILDDPFYDPYLDWFTTKPNLTADSTGWQYFSVNLAYLGSIFPSGVFDTVKFRFTFISDSIPESKDGLMYDNLDFVDYVESISDREEIGQLQVVPNPSNGSNTVSISTRGINLRKVQITDMYGSVVSILNHQNSDKIEFGTSQFANGVYIVKGESKYQNQHFVSKLVIVK